jgi:aldose 1-epimerase
MIAPSGQQIRLRHAGQELTVVEVGGGIRTYTVEGRAVIDGYDESEMCPGGRGQLLAPWPNRLADGTFEWEGQRYQTPLTEPENHNAIHGLVRWAPWSVAAVDPRQARLTYRLHPQPGWPWTLDLAVAYALGDAGFTVVTEVANVGDAGSGACPFGVGWHPYLAAFGELVDQAVLNVPAAEAYRSDERGLPVGRYQVEGTPLDFRRGRPIGEAVLDVAFTGLERGGDGRAVVELRPTDRTPAEPTPADRTPAEPTPADRTPADRTPAGSRAGADSRLYGIRLWLDRAYTHLMIFSGDTLGDTARRRRGLAVEPMTCAPDMLRSGDGRRVLEPGESFEAAWGVETFSFS